MNARIARVAALGIGLALAATSCWVPDWEPLDGDRCDLANNRVCLVGFTCIDGRCRSNADAGPGQCDPFGYTCGATACLTDPCLPDGGCVPPQALTGQSCDGGQCRNDGVCVSMNAEFDCSNGVDDNNNLLADCLDPSCTNVPCSTNKCKNERCQPNGDCSGPVVTCSPPTCFWPGTCNPASGCVYLPDAGAPCNDGNACSQTDLCSAIGTCVGTNPVVCSSPPPDPTCHNAGVCNQTDGGCSYALKTAGTGCDDNNGCTLGETCTAGGLCTGGAAKQCNSPPDAGVCFPATGTCNAPIGNCVYTPLGAGPSATCNDNNPCTSDACDGTGICVLTAVTAGTACTVAANQGICLGSSCAAFAYAPSNFIEPTTRATAAAGGDVVVSTIATINTTNTPPTYTGWTGPQPSASTLTPANGPPVLVLAMRSLTINAGSTLNLTGSRPVIFAVWGDANINGTISAEHDGVTSPAGSNPTLTGGCPAAISGQAGNGRGSGGGGGAFGTDGGTGGDVTVNGTGPPGDGMGANGVAALIPLRGGCPGGQGGEPNNTNGGAPGNGGGAVQISVSGTLTVGPAALITTSGSRGGRGNKDATHSAGGGGGGSGGGILLEGNIVFIQAGSKLTANGGGGGGGAVQGGNNGQDGENGHTIDGLVAQGGAAGGGQGGRGGNGAASTTAAAPGMSNNNSGGGGGGGVGRIRINKGTGTCTISATVLSPPASKGPGCP